MGWDGRGWDIISWQPAVARLRMASGVLGSVGQPSARVCTRTSGMWLHIYMELVLSGWKDAFQVDGQFRRAITGGGWCGMA
jgi:hypothetical protein